MKIPTDVKVGDKFITLVDGQYADKTFPTGTIVSYLGKSKPHDFGDCYYVFPRFKFPNDTLQRRNFSFEDLKKL